MSKQWMWAAGSLLLMCSVACKSGEVISPKELPEGPRFTHTIGDLTPYSGVLQEGLFIVCTSLLSPAGEYIYTVDASPTTEKFVKSVTMGPGECKVVAESKQNWKNTESHNITVTALSAFYHDGLVLIDATCQADCDHPGEPTTALLSGNAGAIAKFYFRRSFFTAGGHGGTGTLNFYLD